MLLPSGHHGGLVDWLRGMVVLGGAAQRGAVTANVSASVLALSGQGSASLTAPPLLLTAVLVGLLALLTVRSERSNPSAAWPVAVGRIVLGAAGYALVWALLGVLVRGQIGFGTAGALEEIGQADVGVSFWSMLGHGLLIGLLLGAAVRLLPLSRTSSWNARLADARHTVTAAATLTVLSWAAAALVAAGWVVYTAATSHQSLTQGLSAPAETASRGQVSAGVAALLLMGAMVVNLVMMGGAMLLGNAVGWNVTGQGLPQSSGDGPTAGSIGILLGSGSSWWYLAPLLLWVLALLVGARPAPGSIRPRAAAGPWRTTSARQSSRRWP